jgi:hypothetical protein
MPPATAIARRFAEAIIALRAIHEFDAWVGQYWRSPCPVPEKAALARADRGTSDAIVWHEGETTIFGFLPGRDGCFCVPLEAALPEFAFATGRPTASYGQDVVISAAMREEFHSPGS